MFMCSCVSITKGFWCNSTRSDGVSVRSLFEQSRIQAECRSDTSNWRAESFITHCRFLSSISSWRTLSFLYLKEREKSNVGGGRVSRVSRPLDFLSREQGSGPVGTLCRISPPAVSLNVWPFFFKPNREVLVPKPNHSPNLITRLSTGLIWVLFWKPNRMLWM